MSASHEAFGEMRSAFERAWTKPGLVTTQDRYLFSGAPVNIRVVGARVAEYILPTLAHLRTREHPLNSPELTIDLWDQAETGIPYPSALQADAPEIRTVLASPDSRFLSDRDTRALTILDRYSGSIVSCFASADGFLMADRARPFSRLLALWYRDHGTHIIHAGMVARKNAGVIFIGKGGSGKSTSALACVSAGLSYLGDDFVGIRERTDGSFLGFSLYASSLLDPDHLRHFPKLTGYAIPSGSHRDPKSLVLISQVFPDRLQHFAAVRAIVLPRVVGAPRPEFQEASKAAALLAIAPSSLALQISPGSRQFDLLARLVQRLPCYWLDLGGSVEEIPACVDTLLNELQR